MAARKSRRRTVKWNVGESPAKLAKQHPPEVAEHAMWELKERDLWTDNLVIGAMWRLRGILSVEKYKPDCIPHEFLYAKPYYDGHQLVAPGIVLKEGSIATYMGRARVTESTDNGRTISVLRHTFLISGVRYMINNLNYIEPAV